MIKNSENAHTIGLAAVEEMMEISDQNSPSCYRKTFCTMDWWTKDLEGSSSSWPFWDEPPRSVDDLSSFDEGEIECAIALSLSEENQKGKKVIEEDNEPEQSEEYQPEEDEKDVTAQLEEDELLAIAIQESLILEPPPRAGYDSGNLVPPNPLIFSSGNRICAGCNTDIGHGQFLSCIGSVWHPDCFCCTVCKLPITDYEFSVSGNRPYHKSCYRELNHPRCDVCNKFADRCLGVLISGIPTNSDGLIEYRAHPFWLQKYCPSHERDGTPRCCSCERMEPRDTRYISLDDGRKLCLECLDSAIMDTHECQPLYFEIREFYEGLNMKEKRLLIITYLRPEGLCLSEEQTVTTVLRRPRIGAGYRFVDMITEPYRLSRRSEVTAILILFGLPRLLTGSILAHEMMHAWLRLKGYPNLRPDVEEGICQVLAHMWLDSEIYSSPGGEAASSASSSSSPASSKKGQRSEFEKKLGRQPNILDFNSVCGMISVRIYGGIEEADTVAF
ncbi:hypothetical protein OIU78_020476 [Salix suchowensis]|nr:hypothetical protein OIU78_020476 [Salix suchowensis]